MKVNRARKNGKRIRVFGAVGRIAALIFIFGSAIIIYFYVHAHPIKPLFPVKFIAFAGNKRLTDEELSVLSGIRANDSVVSVSGKDVSRRLLKSPWVRSVSVRRELPHTISILIKEAEPFALLHMNEHLFLVDENGKLLEELKGDAVPFLPVIAGDPFKEKEGFSEALKLIKLMSAKKFSSEWDRIEIIAHQPHELSVRVDNTVVKVGAGGYEQKIERLVQLEEHIKKMGIPVDYIDLRFADKAIVKPASDKAVAE